MRIAFGTVVFWYVLTLGVELFGSGVSDGYTEEETSVHILCECETLASLKLAHLCCFFLDPEDSRIVNIGATWNFGKGTGFF
jgi:hypothetical protein